MFWQCQIIILLEYFINTYLYNRVTSALGLLLGQLLGLLGLLLDLMGSPMDSLTYLITDDLDWTVTKYKKANNYL